MNELMQFPGGSMVDCAAEQHPVDAYLGGLLSEDSRRVMRGAIRMALRLLLASSNQGEQVAVSDPEYAFDWRLMSVPVLQRMAQAAKQEHYAPATIQRMLSAVRGVSKSAMLLGWISSDALMRMEAQKFRVGTRQKKHLSFDQDEIDQALRSGLGAGSTAHQVRNRAILHCLFKGGLRRQEVCSMQMEWLQRLGEDRWVLNVIGKGNKERRVSLPAASSESLSDWLRLRPTLLHDEDCPNVFLPIHSRWTNGVARPIAAARPLNSQSLYVLTKSWLGLSPHAARHKYITDAIRLSGNIRLAQRLAGHSSPITTAGYDQNDFAQLDELTSKL